MYVRLCVCVCVCVCVENHHVMTCIVGNRINVVFILDKFDHVLKAVKIIIYHQHLLK